MANSILGLGMVEASGIQDPALVAEMGVGSREDDSWAETPETAGVVVF